MELISDPTFHTICRRVAEGETSKKVLEELNIDSFDFYQWVTEDPDRERRYASARKARSEGLVDEIIEIADTESDSQKARNRVDARKWYASKMLPDKYGDRLDVNISGQVDLKAAIEEGAKRALRPVRDQHQVTDAEFIEIPALNASGSSDCVSVNPALPAKKPDVDPFS